MVSVYFICNSLTVHIYFKFGLVLRNNEFCYDTHPKGLSASWNKTLNSLSLPFGRRSHWQHPFLPDSCWGFLVGCHSTLTKIFTVLSLKPVFPGNHILISHWIQLSGSLLKQWCKFHSLYSQVWKKYQSEYVAISALCSVFTTYITLLRHSNKLKRFL